MSINIEEIELQSENTDYENQCTVISRLNVSYLQLFEADLRGLAPKTIKAHLKNIDFFLNGSL